MLNFLPILDVPFKRVGNKKAFTSRFGKSE